MSGTSDRADWAAAILRVLSDVAPAPASARYDVSGSGATAMAWLGLDVTPGTKQVPTTSTLDVLLGGSTPETVTFGTYRMDRGDRLDELAQYDSFTPGLDDLSIGWMWAVGTVELEGERREIRCPLASSTVHLRRDLGTYTAMADPGWDLWPFVKDPAVAGVLESSVETGRGGLPRTTSMSQAYLARFHAMLTWANSVLTASGMEPVKHLSVPKDPRQARPQGLEVIVGYGIFANHGGDLLRPQVSLSTWASTPRIGDTAFASLYLGPRPTPPLSRGEPPPPPRPLRSTLPLSAAQEQAVRRSFDQDVVVVSGPPGTGKSQTAVAIASDAVARGQRVLLATQSAMAADVLAELLDRVPGPTPVLFGGGRRAGELAAKLADGLTTTVDHGTHDRWRQAQRTHDQLAEAVGEDLAEVAALEQWSSLQLTVDLQRRHAPRLFERDDEQAIDEALELLARCHEHHGLLDELRHRRAESRLRHLVDAPEASTLEDIEDAVTTALVRLRARRAGTRDLHLADERWIALVEADESLRAASGREAAADITDRADGDARRAVGALATALRAGRARRRAHLARVDVRSLTEALPLWIGTLPDIEALLPAEPAAFDLVILDEASMIDQGSAAGALLRAERAVVIGDPRQLRFVSFVADDDVDAAVARHQCGPIADKLDVRRASTFDLAAAIAPVTFLDEHFRSVPHLIGFSARRFYEDRLQVTTRHPTNDGVSAIEVVPVAGERTTAGTNQAEIDAAVERVVALLAQDPSASIGVISPHRPQVEALRTAIAAAVPPEQWETGRIRIATVHGFQGSECDVVIASFGISGDGGRTRRFLEDPNLFNVLITRARRRMIVLTSVADVPAGLLADYLHWAEHPPPVPADAPATDTWTKALAGLVADQDVAVRTNYAVGPWTIDLVVGDGRDALAVATHVHPDGPHRHVQRHLALHRAGWRQAEAFPVTEDGAAARLAMDLAARIREP